MLIKGFSSEWLEELKQRNDILEVVSKYVSMERKGGRYWGRCPFHHEKTPSFTVSSERGFYHCFGCHESGDVINFITKIENIEFYDAINLLASRVGMQVPELKDVNAKSNREEKDRMLALMKDAARFYHSKLKDSPKSLRYLEKRGINKNTIVKFGIGQSPDYQSLIKELRSKGYNNKQMLDAGVAFEKGELLDALGGRLIIPIFDSTGRVVAFGGRALDKTDFAKYKNTKETAIFTKNKVLYGLNFVNKLRQSQKVEDIIIVEGYMDAIALVQAGVQNVVASMGTSLTEQQARVLKNHVDKVFICYDGDAAGHASALRGMDILKSKGLNVKVISLPEGFDPDEVIAKYGVNGFLEFKEKALPLVEYKLSKAEALFDLESPDGRSGFAKRALSVIADLDEVEKDAYLEVIAKKSGINKDSLAKGKELIIEEKKIYKEPKEVKNSAYMNACRFVLLSKLASKPYANVAFDRDILSEDTHIKIYDYLVDCEKSGIAPHPSMIYELDGDSGECAEMLNCNPKIQKSEEKRYFEDCLKTIEKEYYGNLINELTEEYSVATDSEKQADILNKISELNQKIRR